MSLGDFTLNKEGEDGTYEIDTFVIFAGLISAFITLWVATFIDTQPVLAAKAGFELEIESVALAFGGLFAFLLRSQYDKDIFVLAKSPNIGAIGLGLASILPLVIIQAAARTLVPGSIAASATIAPSSGLGALFYATAAINETFLAQMVLYTVLAQILAGLDEEIGWEEFILAGLLIVPGIMGFLHYAVEGAALPAILGIAMDFAFLDFMYQVTGSLTTPMVGHLSLNLVSATVGSIFPLMFLGSNIASMLPFLAAFGVMAATMAYWSHKGVLRERLNRNLTKRRLTLAPVRSANAGVNPA